MRGEKRLRCEAIERRLRRHERDVTFAARDPVERREALGNEILVRREMIVRKRLPIGKRADGKRGREPRHFLRETGGGQRVGTDDGEHSMLAPCGESDLREGERVGGSRKGRKHQPPAALRQDGRERRQRRKRICERVVRRRRIRRLPGEVLRRPSQDRSRPSACEKRERDDSRTAIIRKWGQSEYAGRLTTTAARARPYSL